MTNFIYLQSNASGIGDRLMDLILVYTYSQYLHYDNLYLHWIENTSNMTGDDSFYSKLRKQKTPFREYDYLLKNLLNYIILPSNIHFVSQDELKEKCIDSNIILPSNIHFVSQDELDKLKEKCIDSNIILPSNIHSISQDELDELKEKCIDSNIIFKDYLGMKYSLYSFMEKYYIKDKKLFEKNYFENFNKIKFKNIPDNIVNTFKNKEIITIHLRRGDKVCDNVGQTNGITKNQLSDLDNKTEQFILNRINNDFKNICFISDEKIVRNKYIDKFKDKCNLLYFDGNEISQTYYDLYCLVHSKEILLSQNFSVFSIFSSMIRQNKLHYLLDGNKINVFSKYKNINKYN